MTTTRTFRPARSTNGAVFGSAADWGLLFIRLTFGLLMAAHGAQKLFGIFGGQGLTATGKGFETFGYRPGKVFATIAGLSELLGGLGLAVGLLTPLACAALIGVMINAMALVTAPKGLWASDGGLEYNLCIAAVALGIAATGPGRLSLDRFFPWGRGGWLSAALALGLGGIGAAITLSL
ncbi:MULTISPECIES: DoxX family protein [unclassified Streptomyces]|uniref:DoxX family protein n=1 Tax=unclassified Streptomyces TaxID=2593676 RepID=UPI002E2A0AB3|nr:MULTISPECIES: DoxX family protein [unclassified Streptomyces]WUB88899.1 DoxX family protein [Streptomyces sp. NBC_00566]